jgi:hypothetical protein
MLYGRRFDVEKGERMVVERTIISYVRCALWVGWVASRARCARFRAAMRDFCSWIATADDDDDQTRSQMLEE